MAGSATQRPTRQVSRDLEILIVGAGPVGLTAALELGRHGFRPRIVERDAGPHRESRALAVNPRSLDILGPSGAARQMLAAGREARAANLHGPDGEVLFRLDLANMPHPRKAMLVLPQAETERLLIETLGGLEAVEWGTALTGLEMQGGQPRVTLEKDGRQEWVTPDMLIAADGAHSRVRHKLGIDFAGQSYEHDWGLADLRLSGPLTEGELHIFDCSPLLFGLIPLTEPGCYRVFTDQASATRDLPGQLKIEEVLWESRFRISHRQVARYQIGERVFLAGDAAHIHSPLGGRGMNLGIEDAAWLAWLIAEGRPGLYHEFRHPPGRRVIRRVDRATRLMSSDGAAAKLFRRKLMPLLMRFPAVQAQALKTIAGLDTEPPPWLRR